jgi:diadenosine tetraphosphate (Ap4A) HIT family hydrolase
MSCIIHKRVELAQKGKNDFVICRMASGWAVMGDEQFFEGYCLLLPDPVVEHLTDLNKAKRGEFLVDMAAIGEALLQETKAYRINYAIIGAVDCVLHAHIYPRYHTKHPEYKNKTIWEYPDEMVKSVKYDKKIHGNLQERLKARLESL